MRHPRARALLSFRIVHAAKKGLVQNLLPKILCVLCFSFVLALQNRLIACKNSLTIRNASRKVVSEEEDFTVTRLSANAKRL